MKKMKRPKQVTLFAIATETENTLVIPVVIDMDKADNGELGLMAVGANSIYALLSDLIKQSTMSNHSAVKVTPDNVFQLLAEHTGIDDVYLADVESVELLVSHASGMEKGRDSPRIFIPKNVSEEDGLSDIIGMIQVQRMVEGDKIRIPGLSNITRVFEVSEGKNGSELMLPPSEA